MKSPSLSKSIMRRVYYAYAIALALHPTSLRVMVLTVGLGLIAQLVHIAVIYKVLLETKLGDIVPFTVSLVTHADWPTLIVTFVVIMTLLSFKIPVYKRPHRVARA